MLGGFSYFFWVLGYSIMLFAASSRDERSSGGLGCGRPALSTPYSEASLAEGLLAFKSIIFFKLAYLVTACVAKGHRPFRRLLPGCLLPSYPDPQNEVLSTLTQQYLN